MEQVRLWMDKIDALSLRERAVILAGAVIVMYSLWDTFLLQPQLIEEKRLLAELQIKRAEQVALNYRIQEMLKQTRSDPEQANRDRLEQLRQQLAGLEQNMVQTTSHLVAPDKMALILQTILSRSRGLELLEISGLGVKPLIETPVSAEAAPAQQGNPVPGDLDNAWKHGLVIRLEGDYMSTLNYLRELESLEWGFFWENIEYEVTEYPRGRVAITLYTLSLQKDWIGV